MLGKETLLRLLLRPQDLVGCSLRPGGVFGNVQFNHSACFLSFVEMLLIVCVVVWFLCWFFVPFRYSVLISQHSLSIPDYSVSIAQRASPLVSQSHCKGTKKRNAKQAIGEKGAQKSALLILTAVTYFRFQFSVFIFLPPPKA